MKKGKKYLEKEKLVDREISFNPNKAFELVKETGFARFDESIEVHFKLGIDPRHSDQQLRGTVVLPNGDIITVQCYEFSDNFKEKYNFINYTSLNTRTRFR